jgi:putative ABC transport system permease protein
MIIIPHFILPLEYFKGGSGALLPVECSIWHHPEIFSGMLAVAGGLLYMRYRKALFIMASAGVSGILFSIILRPVSFYLQSEDPLIILSHTVSMTAHQNLRPVILILSLIILSSSLLPLMARKEKYRIRLTPLYISSKNTRRKQFRSAALVISLTIVIGAFFSDILLTRSIENTLEVGAGRLGADLMVVPAGKEKAARTVLLSGEPTIFYMNKDILETLKGFPEIEKLSPQLYIQPFSYLVCCTFETFLIIAYDPGTDFTVAPWIRYSLKAVQGPYDLVIGNSVKFYPGQKIDLFGKTLNIVATLEPTGLGYFDNSAFIPLTSARELLRHLVEQERKGKIKTKEEILDLSFDHLYATDREDRVEIGDLDPEGFSAIFVKARDNVSIRNLADKIRRETEGTTVISVKESTLSIKRHISSILGAFLLPVVILLVMGTVVLGIVFSMSVTERRREIGMFRALGARKKDVFMIILTESLGISLIGGIFGVLFGSSLLLLFKNRIMAALNLLYIWPSPVVIFKVLLMTTIVSLTVGIMAGLYPALRASRMEPYNAIRTGGG